MEEAQFLVTHKTNDYPTSLRTAEEIASQIDGISAERIIDLADAGYLPHYRIDGGPAMFKTSEVKHWVNNNLVSRCNGRALPDAIKVVISAPPVIDAPPASITNIPNLQQIPRHVYQPGVYFLCDGDEVVYVGQSVSPSSRVGQHGNDKKKIFDRVYLLPVPKFDLNEVEAAFIHHLRPRLQGAYGKDRETLRSCRMTRPMDEIMKSVCCDT